MVSGASPNPNNDNPAFGGSRRDAQGRYSFPAAKLEPGKYSLMVRAMGYDPDGPASVEISSGKNRQCRGQARAAGLS